MRVREMVWHGDRGEGSIFFRLKNGRRISGSLYLTYRADGKEQVVSARTNNLEDAKRELRRLTRNRDNAAEGLETLRTPKAERVTVKQLVEAYLYDAEHEKKCVSVAAMRSHAKPILEALGALRAVDLKPEQVRRYKERRRAQAPRYGKDGDKVSDTKISREVEILKAAFNHAARQGAIRLVPVIELPTVRNARKVFFPLERVPEMLEVAATFDGDVRDFLHWQSFSGMRPKAIRLLRWDYLDGKDWVLTLPSQEDKNEMGRELDIAGEAKEILERRLAKRQVGDVFIFGNAKPIANKLVWKTWNAVMEKMELPSGEEGYRPYDLKKTALRALRRAGIPEERAMFFSGHRTANTFRRYDVTAREDNREDMQRATEYRAKRFADKTAADPDKTAKLLRIPKRAEE
jgi:integrase